MTWLAMGAMATLVLACQQAVTPVKEEPQPPPKPTLVGTWERVTEWEDEDGDRITSTNRLVFAENGKAFHHVMQWNLVGEEHHGPYGDIADWSATEDTITRTFILWDDQQDDWGDTSITLDKTYSLSDSGEVLFVHCWECRDRQDQFERYSRVQDPVPQNPSLLGTWQYVGSYWDDDGLVGTSTSTLTFTENRYILYEVDRIDDDVIDSSASSGTWNVAASRVTKTFAHRERDDDGNWMVEERSFEKEYSWGAGGELFVVDWRGNWEGVSEQQNPSIQRYTRVADPLPPLAGTWVYELIRERDGELETYRDTMTIDDSFTYTYESERGTRSYDISYTGSWRHEESKMFLFVDVHSASVNFGEDYAPELSSQVKSELEGHEMRIAYAPTGIPNKIAVSSHTREREYTENTDMWVDSELPYGDYDVLFERQDGP